MKKSVLYIIVVILVLGLGTLYFFKYHYLPKKYIPIKPVEDTTAIKKEILKIYEIPADSFLIEEGHIGQNETLTDLLKKYNMPEGWRANLIQVPRSKLDMRRIRAGNKFTIFLTKDTLCLLRYLVYEHTPVEYVKLKFTDTLIVTKGEKEIRIVEKRATGTISTSLWNAMVDRDITPLLANDLSEIYAWSIDFFGLQVGDSFNVIYDEHFVDTLSIGLGKIHTAYFYHAGKDFYAIPFVQDSVKDFYDLDGNSLRKAFLKAPLNFSRISSRFSHSRMHPILKIRRPHHGVDYAAPAGTPVQAIGDGQIISAKHGYNRGAGNMLKIKHNGTYTTAYLHLRSFAKGIKTGVWVKQGDVIGYVGSTGLSTGAHLDFRFYKNGHAIDPLKVDAPPVDPIREENKATYDSVKAIYIDLLKGVNKFTSP